MIIAALSLALAAQAAAPVTAVRGDPLTTIALLERVEWVMKGGTVVRR